MMRPGTLLVAVVLSVPGMACAQRVKVAPPAEQIAAAVLPLPEGMRASATVLGYNASGRLTTLRKGEGQMTCLAQDPAAEQFHVACYHNSLEPFMARGRELRASGVQGPQVDTVRFREAKEGKLKMPDGPASLYQLNGGTFDPKTGAAPGSKELYVVYIPYATAASTGLPDKPSSGPWLMFPGTPKAHIMFTTSM